MSSDNVQPPWEQPQQEKGKGGGGHWKKGMASPNPNGRPKGIIDRRLKMRKELMRDAPEVLQVVIDAAKGGCIQSANILLQRVLPTIKSQAERVEFEFYEDAAPADQARQIMAAVAAGALDPDTGKVMLDCISTVRGISQVDELEARIRELEERLKS